MPAVFPDLILFFVYFRLVQQPNCIKVPKEVCVNERVNPKKVRDVIKILYFLKLKLAVDLSDSI